MELEERSAQGQAEERQMVSLTTRERSQVEKDGTPVSSGCVEKLVRIGFSEYEARAYVALIKSSPMTGDMLAQVSRIPRALGSRIAEQLVERGAAITLPIDSALKYAPIPADELLDRLQQEHADLLVSIRKDLYAYTSPLDLDPVWNIEGETNLLARAEVMIRQATKRVYVGALPVTIEAMRPALESAAGREIQVVVYTTGHINLPGARVIVTPCPEAALEQMSKTGLILVRDGQEALIGEWSAPRRAQAAWTHAPTLVSIAEQHLLRGGRRRFAVAEETGHQGTKH